MSGHKLIVDLLHYKILCRNQRIFIVFPIQTSMQEGNIKRKVANNKQTKHNQINRKIVQQRNTRKQKSN